MVLIVIQYSIIVCQAIAGVFIGAMLQAIVPGPSRFQKTWRDEAANSCAKETRLFGSPPHNRTQDNLFLYQYHVTGFQGGKKPNEANTLKNKIRRMIHQAVALYLVSC